MGMPIYRPCMANNSAGTKLGAALHPQILSLEVVPFKGGRSILSKNAGGAIMEKSPPDEVGEKAAKEIEGL